MAPYDIRHDQDDDPAPRLLGNRRDRGKRLTFARSHGHADSALPRSDRARKRALLGRNVKHDIELQRRALVVREHRDDGKRLERGANHRACSLLNRQRGVTIDLGQNMRCAEQMDQGIISQDGNRIGKPCPGGSSRHFEYRSVHKNARMRTRGPQMLVVGCGTLGAGSRGRAFGFKRLQRLRLHVASRAGLVVASHRTYAFCATGEQKTSCKATNRRDSPHSWTSTHWLARAHASRQRRTPSPPDSFPNRRGCELIR